MLKYKSKIPNYTEFDNKVNEICKSLKIQPEWLYEVMNIETAGTFSPSIKNAAGSGATGLIQFMPSTAADLGTSTANLAKMSNVKQLDFVKLYFQRVFAMVKVTPNNFFDLYLTVFHPYWIGKPDSTPLKGNEVPYGGGKVFSLNRFIDLDKNGIITKGEFRTWATKNIKGFSSALVDTAKKQFPHC